MNTTQKDPSQLVPTEGRHDQARKHEIIFPGLMDADMRLVAAVEIRLLDGLEARLYQKLNNVIENLRKQAYKTPSV